MTRNRHLSLSILAMAAASVACGSSTEPATPLPAAPSGVRAAPGNEYVSLSWTPVDGATLYNVYWEYGSATSPASGVKIAGVRSPYTVMGLTNDFSFAFVVTALNSAGESDPSAPVTATPTFSDALVIIPAALPVGRVGRDYGPDSMRTLLCFWSQFLPGHISCIECPVGVNCKVLPPCATPNQTDCWRQVPIFAGFTFQAAGGQAPYAFSGASLPPGLSVNDSGQIRGTPTAPGTFDFPVTVTDSAAPAHATTELHTIVVNP